MANKLMGGNHKLAASQLISSTTPSAQHSMTT